MKRLIFLLFLCPGVNAQTYKYCELIGFPNEEMTKVTVVVDLGKPIFGNKTLLDTVILPPAMSEEKYYLPATYNKATYEGQKVLKDETGKYILRYVETAPAEKTVGVREFNSMVEALNDISRRGWEFVQAYTVSRNNKTVHHWILRKKT